MSRLLEASERTERAVQQISTAVAAFAGEARLRMEKLDAINDTLVRTKVGEVADTIARLRRINRPIHASSSAMLEYLATRHVPEVAAELSKVESDDIAFPVRVGDLTLLRHVSG